MIATAIATLALTLLLYWKLWHKNGRLRTFAETLPGPKAWPLVGNLLIFAVPRKDLFRTFNRVQRQYETPCRFWMGNKLLVAFDRPEHLEKLMTSPIASHKADEYGIIAECIGWGLIQSSGAKHKLHRKLMAMPLRSQILDGHVEKFDAKGDECAAWLGEMVGRGTFDVYERVESCSFALVTEIIMGVKVDSRSSENHRMSQTISRVYESVAERIYKFWLHPYVAYRLSKHYTLQKESMKVFNDFLAKTVDEKVAELSRCGEKDPEQVSLEWLLHLRDDEQKPIFSREEIYEELSSLFTASEDTTATIVSFTLLMLAIHKDAQQKVYEEQLEVMGSNDCRLPIQSHQLANMKYLHMVIQEVLRLFPIAPSLMRKLTDDFKLGDIVIPKEATVLIQIYGVHMNEKIWPDPTKFDPTRFTPEEKAKRPPFSHLPFSGGLRGCIGKKFAFMAIKCFVSHIVRRYELHTDWKMEDIILEADISVRSTNGYKIAIERRL